MSESTAHQEVRVQSGNRGEVRFFRRVLILGLLGGGFGTVVGAFYWGRSPEKFESTARIQSLWDKPLALSSDSAGCSTLDESNCSTSIADEVLRIRSRSVLEEAIKSAKWVGRIEELRDKTPVEILDWLNDESRLSVRLASGRPTNVIEITFRHEEREHCDDVAISIVEAYEKTLGREELNRNAELLRRLARFRDEYDTRGKQIQNEYLKFFEKSELIRVGDEFKDPRTETLLMLNRRLDEVHTEIIHCRASMKAIEKSEKLGYDINLREKPVSTALNTPESSNQEILLETLKALENEEQLIRLSIDENRDKWIKNESRIRELENILREKHKVDTTSEELRRTLESLSFQAGSGGRWIRRLDIPNDAKPAGPDLRAFLGYYGFIGLGLGAALGIVSSCCARRGLSHDDRKP